MSVCMLQASYLQGMDMSRWNNCDVQLKSRNLDNAQAYLDAKEIFERTIGDGKDDKKDRKQGAGLFFFVFVDCNIVINIHFLYMENREKGKKV